MKFWTSVTNISPQTSTPLDDNLFLHCTYYIGVHTMWNNSQARYFREYRICVELPTMLNIELEYVLFTWGDAQGLWVPFSLSNYSLEKLSAAIVLWAHISSPQVGIWLIMEIQKCANWHLKTWKCQIANLPPPPPTSSSWCTTSLPTRLPGANHW